MTNETEMTPEARIHEIRRTRAHQARRRFWIAASFLFSAGVLFWAYSLAMRTSESRSTTSQPRPAQRETASPNLDLKDQVRLRREAGEKYRRSALVMDRMVMDAVSDRQQPKVRPVSNRREVAVENRQVYEDGLRRDIESLGTPLRGSPEWHYQRDLLRELRSGDDVPR